MPRRNEFYFPVVKTIFYEQFGSLKIGRCIITICNRRVIKCDNVVKVCDSLVYYKLRRFLVTVGNRCVVTIKMRRCGIKITKGITGKTRRYYNLYILHLFTSLHLKL